MNIKVGQLKALLIKEVVKEIDNYKSQYPDLDYKYQGKYQILDYIEEVFLDTKDNDAEAIITLLIRKVVDEMSIFYKDRVYGGFLNDSYRRINAGFRHLWAFMDNCKDTDCHKSCIYLDKAAEYCNDYGETLDFGDNNDDTFVKCQKCIDKEGAE